MTRIKSVFMPEVGAASYTLIAALFTRLLGLIYLMAFVSLGVQIEGLAGSEGILPFAQFLEQYAAQSGMERYVTLPTLFWLNAGDTALVGATVVGSVAAVMIFLNWFSRFALCVAFVFYLSLYYAGQAFMNFQWDTLLLEAGFLAIFLTPGSRLVIFLFRWLLFRLRFMSGLSKLVSEDPTWADGTALKYYFEVQPLPTPLAWYAHQLPDWLLKTGTFGTLVVELLVPFMMFLPRRWRFAAAWITILWQVAIILTSNHNWFNFLTIALCLFLFDDKAIQRVLPVGVISILTPTPSTALKQNRLRSLSLQALALLIIFSSAVQLWELATMRRSNGLITRFVDLVERYRIVNKYHVFPTMKTERIELVILGSHDGRNWQAYSFKYKPGDPNQRPSFVIPHQPRLDWMMWFVTLHPLHRHWFEPFLQSLRANSPAVTDLLAHNPFAENPPRYLRVMAYRYRFTDFTQRQDTGRWWQIQPLGPFIPWY